VRLKKKKGIGSGKGVCSNLGLMGRSGAGQCTAGRRGALVIIKRYCKRG